MRRCWLSRRSEGNSVAAKADDESIAFGGQNLRGRSHCNKLAFTKEQNLGAGSKRVSHVVRGKDGLDAIFAKPPLQAFKQRIARDAVERGEGLVEK
jgi:hypothetical protein